MTAFDRFDLVRVWFVTLTQSPKTRSQDNGLPVMQSGISKLIKRMRRLHDKAISQFAYVRVYEQHKSGIYHAHILMLWYPVPRKKTESKHIYKTGKRKGKINTKKWLKDISYECGLGYIADIKELDITQIDTTDNPILRVVSYVTKYMTKAVQERIQGENSGLRIIQASQNIPKELAYTDDLEVFDQWRVQTELHEYDYHTIQHPVIDVQKKQAIKDDDFKNSIYPLDLD